MASRSYNDRHENAGLPSIQMRPHSPLSLSRTLSKKPLEAWAVVSTRGSSDG